MKFMEESASTKTNKLIEELKEKEAIVMEQAKRLEVVYKINWLFSLNVSNRSYKQQSIPNQKKWKKF